VNKVQPLLAILAGLRSEYSAVIGREGGALSRARLVVFSSTQLEHGTAPRVTRSSLIASSALGTKSPLSSLDHVD
jgi:hypothetical protein